MTSLKVFLISIALVFTFTSCSVDKALERVKMNLQSDSKDWIVSYESIQDLKFLSDQGEKVVFKHVNAVNTFSTSSAKQFGIYTKAYTYETASESFSSTYPNNLQVTVRANEESDYLTITLDSWTFVIPLNYKEIINISERNNNDMKTATIENNQIVPYAGSKPILSKVELIDELYLNGKSIANGFKISILDFEENWTETTLESFIIAPNYGLVQYSLQDGLSFNRVD